MKPKLVPSLPESPTPRYDHVALAAMMREHPGQWVRIDKRVRNQAYALAAKWRRVRPKAYGEGSFEFRAISAGYGTGEAKLFGRYVEEA